MMGSKDQTAVWYQQAAAMMYAKADNYRKIGSIYLAAKFQHIAAKSADMARRVMFARFAIAGGEFTMVDMVNANKHDQDVCDWLSTAQVGDVCPLGGETVRRVA